MKLRVKGFGLLLLLVLLALCSTIDVCDARRGKHWRPRSSPSSSLLKKKGKAKKGSSHRQHGGNRRSPPPAPPGVGKGHQTPYQPSPNVPVSPSPSPSPKPSPAKGNGHTSPQPPSPSCGKGRQPPPQPPPAASASPGAVFNVVDFGAKGDGISDDTKAFQAAWAAACKLGASTVLVPSELEFLVGPISFSGPYCKPNILFQLEGTILAPTNAKAWGSGLLQWLEFTKLSGLSIQGSGTINGRGQQWWTYSDPNDDEDDDTVRPDHLVLLDHSIQKLVYQSLTLDTFQQYNQELERMPRVKPTALRFYGSSNVVVAGITIVNSSQCHLKFDNCQGVLVHDLTISSPENSLNTDGIHLQNSKDVSIHHTNLACGDDCISIQTGCSNIYIHNVNCGPGHGISIGGLGRDNTKACVSNVTVRDVNMFRTMTGVRIKTWQGGIGLVQDIRFSNIQVSEVQTPIMIDQFYCDKRTCTNQTSAVAVSGVQYENIRGTFTIKPLHFACSDSSPCSGITLTGVQLKPVQIAHYHLNNPFCWQAFGELFTPTIPPIACLQIGKPAGNNLQSYHDIC
ncbi:polygalacturonase At1g48100-like isoform X1 [Triticum dicoccoides]|uniref:polygalacturonase At1g48100-like isoform X1 n=1 Tax=Triticum dicoccoides TaxID=85692 RepID=UPI000E78BC6E|nr:polygalacturonase At1g48100-like isoform X1 [Triticum dicoccoides]